MQTRALNRAIHAHRNVSKLLYVYSDASDTFWSGTIDQVPSEDLSRTHVQQQHQLLNFLSGMFSSTQLRWSVLDKEALAVMATLDLMY